MSQWWIEDYNRQLDKRHSELRDEREYIRSKEEEAREWLWDRTEQDRLDQIYKHNHMVLEAYRGEE
jgi:hypothetical protein